MTYKIGHISDLHVLDIPRSELLPHRFLNKRLVGGANLLFHRADAHSVAVVHRALERLDEEGVDHVCITGDLTNLALDSEFEAAHRLVLDIDKPYERVSVIPGNHDAYTYSAERDGRFEYFFSDFLKSDLPQHQGSRGYPFCHLRGEVAVIGLSSAVATPPLFATGLVDDEQLEHLQTLLDDDTVKSRFKVVMVHHPLTDFEHARTNRFRRLVNADDVMRICRLGNVDLVIHGHNHHFSTQEIPHLNGPGTMYICEAGSTSTRDYTNPRFAGTYNIFHDGHLSRIETHLYEGHEDSFVHWHEETYQRVIS